jgi:hypothetical protein
MELRDSRLKPAYLSLETIDLLEILIEVNRGGRHA